MKVEQRFIPEAGVTLDGVWVPCSFLDELAEQGRYNSHSGKVLLAPGKDVKRVCENLDLLETETRGGVHRGERLAAFLDRLDWDDYRTEIPAPGGIPGSVWLAEYTSPPSAVILGIVSSPEAGRAACQDVANQYFGAKNTPPLNWHGDDGHASTSYTDPSGTYFFQVTWFTVDEIREDTS